MKDFLKLHRQEEKARQDYHNAHKGYQQTLWERKSYLNSNFERTESNINKLLQLNSKLSTNTEIAIRESIRQFNIISKRIKEEGDIEIFMSKFAVEFAFRLDREHFCDLYELGFESRMTDSKCIYSVYEEIPYSCDIGIHGCDELIEYLKWYTPEFRHDFLGNICHVMSHFIENTPYSYYDLIRMDKVYCDVKVWITNSIDI